jgi:hypothetical protein
MSFQLSSSQRGKTVGMDEELPDSFRDEYWNHVKETLARVFGKDGSLADEARRKLERLESEKGRHTIFYHAIPLEVAADLAKAAQITQEQQAAYLELQNNWNQVPPGADPEVVRKDSESVREKHLGLTHPEA